MLRRCDGKDPNLVKEDGKTPCDCGAVFDDVDWMVIHPHYHVKGGDSLRPALGLPISGHIEEE